MGKQGKHTESLCGNPAMASVRETVVKNYRNMQPWTDYSYRQNHETPLLNTLYTRRKHILDQVFWIVYWYGYAEVYIEDQLEVA